MRRQFMIFSLIFGALASTPALALNNDDYTAMMGMLWRLREPICPSMSFDPAIFVKAMKLPGSSPEAVRRGHRAAFDRGYAIATDWIGQGTTADFRKAIQTFFDGKHDFYGAVKATPEASVPGLTIRD
jgi:hypothetical protein